ncbi:MULTISPECIES: type VI secretion system baseplate subunit TssE [unclassified Pseudomonas]|jgi:type VI secretion system lysozyme-related protein|uniref:type VI secretion system baseplate subunit TssE n=1 Tax=unclassified Pseudomonas TaxID=196821 RepID=UPI000C84B305|nr:MULTISPECIES: type VI secretion system baseplate subunit TssE [unclassified Pseudomonas]MDX9669654.1 type VI secretion system baseplate subunit TssE [Pseudomonas sp. P8_250]PMQ09781.1 Anti-adapter protein IraD [Pseudomonas sp. AD21]WPN36314.1 type VI secretion system baseplate subunit TssE [Pseudomonas sp. P8_139]WPN41885.1 type VI secretion system baseplate subunit TssE [Pseudomonas sp. P8_229]
MAGTGILPPLFERLASSEAQGAREFNRQDLLDSVHAELGRLFNTRRGPRTLTEPPSVIDYGIADWSALQQQRSDDRRRLARDIREAVTHFEPRLKLGEVQVNALPEHPQQLSIRLVGELRSGLQYWPVAFVIEPGGEGLEVRHERLD